MIANHQQDGAIVNAGSLEGLEAPGEPVDRLVGMLQQVWAGLEDQPIGERGRRDTGCTRRSRRMACSMLAVGLDQSRLEKLRPWQATRGGSDARRRRRGVGGQRGWVHIGRYTRTCVGRRHGAGSRQALEVTALGPQQE